MPPLPPANLVLDAFRHAVLPAAGGAALVMCVFLVLGRWAAALGSAAAVVVAFGWANYTFEAASWDNTARLIPWKPDAEVPRAWHWLPRAALVLVVVGLASRWLGLVAARYLPEKRWWGANLLVWAPRVAAVATVSGWLLSEKATTEWAWLWPALAAAMLLVWVALDGLARSGTSAEVSAYQSLIFLAAAAVLIHHHWAGAMELAVVLGCAMFGIAVATAVRTLAEPVPELLPWEQPPPPTAASGAVPATVAFLPGLMLNGRLQADSLVPLVSFWLVALAPLVLAPFLIPRLNRQTGWLPRAVRAVLILAPIVAAVVLAVQHENLAFEEEW